jgi:hypothetical protein
MHVRRSILAAFSALLLMLASFAIASAHEHREVGEYTFTVGFRVEPALVNQPNGLDLRVDHGHGDAAEPVEGLQETLQAEIMYGGETMPLEMRGVWGQPGRYTADVIPTETGTYSFRIFGTINGTQVDETFVGGPDTFSEVASTEPISFPSAGAAAAGGATTASDAQDTANTAQTLAIVALVLGALGLVAGAGAFMAARSRPATAGGGASIAREAGD